MSFFKLFSPSKISDQLKNSSEKISRSIGQILTHKKIDDKTLDELEEILIANDLGFDVASEIIGKMRSQKFIKNIEEAQIIDFLCSEIEKILVKCEANLSITSDKKPFVITFNGVNGAGKTTTIGKIASNLESQGKKVLIAACDTFRAAASNQIEVWAKRAKCEIILPIKDGEDPASVAYRSLEVAIKNNFDVLLIDTAGRLQNKQNLMDELKKISLVLKKLLVEAPHLSLIVVDGTTGQNAKSQVEAFSKAVGINGLVITKLDGTSRGGIVVALARNFSLPIFGIGVGEKITDLQEFNAASFARNLLGKNEQENKLNKIQ